MFDKTFIRSVLLLVAVLLYAHVAGQHSFPRKYKKIQQYLDRATNSNLAAVVIYIKHPQYGVWTTASGYSDIESKTKLQVADVFSLASIGKMYNAVAIMKLAEEGKLRLDDTISRYLPAELSDSLPGARRTTIRQLLGHRSGLVNYENDTALNRLYLSGSLKLDTLTHINALRRYVYGRPAIAAPGAAYNYSSTNYMLLAMIADSVAPGGHTAYLRALLAAHGFINTWYRETPLHDNIHYYGDLNRDGIKEDITAQTLETTNWFMGDDGVYATVTEAGKFIEDLFSFKILNAASVKEMTTWNNDARPDYGLGLMADKGFPYHFLMGHSGRSIGATGDLYYFPRQQMTIAIFCNTGLRSAAPAFRKSYNKMRSAIIKKLFLF